MAAALRMKLVFCQEFFDGLKTLKKHTLKFSQLWFIPNPLATATELALIPSPCILRIER